MGHKNAKYADDMEKEKNTTDIQAIGMGILAGTGLLVLAIIVYILIAMMGDYHPVFTLMIYMGPGFGYILGVDKIKKMKKDRKEEIEGTTSKKSKFYIPQFGDTVTSLELTIGTLFTLIVSFVGVYMAEVLSFTFYNLKEIEPPKPSFSEIFAYGFSNALQIEGTSAYIVWGWIGFVVSTLVLIVVVIIRKVKGKNIYGEY